MIETQSSVNSAAASLRALCVFVVFISACGTAGNVKVYPVKGHVNYNGKPLVGGGAISFVPLTNQRGKTAGGEIKADGSYVMMTYKSGDGSMTGEFRVVINQIVYKESERKGDGEGKTVGPTAVVAEADRIPAVYSDWSQSPLTATIEAKPTQIDFDLKRQ